MRSDTSIRRPAHLEVTRGRVPVAGNADQLQVRKVDQLDRSHRIARGVPFGPGAREGRPMDSRILTVIVTGGRPDDAASMDPTLGLPVGTGRQPREGNGSQDLRSETRQAHGPAPANADRRARRDQDWKLLINTKVEGEFL